MYLDVHGLAFETSICYRQDQSGILLAVIECLIVNSIYTLFTHTHTLCIGYIFVNTPMTCLKLHTHTQDVVVKMYIAYSDAMYHSLLSHAKGANSLCMVLVLSLLLMYMFEIHNHHHHSSSESLVYFIHTLFVHRYWTDARKREHLARSGVFFSTLLPALFFWFCCLNNSVAIDVRGTYPYCGWSSYSFCLPWLSRSWLWIVWVLVVDELLALHTYACRHLMFHIHWDSLLLAVSGLLLAFLSKLPLIWLIPSHRPTLPHSRLADRYSPHFLKSHWSAAKICWIERIWIVHFVSWFIYGLFFAISTYCL